MSFYWLHIIFIIINVYNLNNSKKISSIDNNIRNANYIRPIISEKSDLYIIRGETCDKDYNPNTKTFIRYISKFDVNSGILFKNFL